MADFNILQGSKVYVCATAADTDKTQTNYEAMTWVNVNKVGSISEFGNSSNFVQYVTLDQDVESNQKGRGSAGQVTIEVSSIHDSAGQVILRTFGDPTNKTNMPIKIEMNDGAEGETNSIFYSRGVVSGPTLLGGGADDFQVERFVVACNQLWIKVDPA